MSTLPLKQFFLNFEKRAGDEQIVEGIISSESEDSQGEVVAYEALKEAAEDYMRFANVREMHQPSAVGKVLELICDDVAKKVRVVVKVVDKDAWLKVKEGVYKGFSIGGRALKKVGNRILKLLLREISLVDRPANPDALFEIFKMDQAEEDELRKGMWNLSRLAELYSNLEMVLSDVIYREEMAEEDPSDLRKLLEAARKKLGEAVVRMADIEVKELKGRKGARAQKGDAVSKFKLVDLKKVLETMQGEEIDIADLQKALAGGTPEARTDSPDLKAIQATLLSIHKSMGATGKDEAPAALAKAAQDQADLTKTLGAMTEAMKAISDKVETISKAVPAPAAVVLQAPVTKAGETKPAPDKDELDLNNPDVTKAMKPKDILKAIHASGGEMVPVGTR